MPSFRNKSLSLATSLILMVLFAVPSAFAVECDKDADGYIVIPTNVMSQVAKDTPYDENGTYNAAQWQSYFKMYSGAQSQLTDAEKCDGLNFKKGAEPSRCDAPIVGPGSGLYDPARVTTSLQGNQFNPDAFDVPGNGIDENCDGSDAQLLPGGGAGATKDIKGLGQKVMSLLSYLVIFASVAIMVWGGFLYATAAGDESKTAKARKAIIGAIIGLLVGLLAPTIVNMIAANLA